ncbi:MAG: transglutaminase [Syntrophus sp. (in: bacteria)]|nr:transglutaminase [Syntrophus sp. (in: bacteria)]
MTTTATEDFGIYLRPTRFIDSDHPEVIAFAQAAAGGAVGDIDRAIRIFYTVRDQIRYDPYCLDLAREKFKASVVLEKKAGYCVEKALLLAATARVLGIPGRLRFADVRNHLTTARLREIMQTDLFIFHGYAELFLNDRWVKATPTFNLSLCERFGVKPLGFDGQHDAIFHEFDCKGNRHMEYVHDHGPFVDLPYDLIMDTFRKHYPVYFTQDKSFPAGDFEAEALKEREA